MSDQHPRGKLKIFIGYSDGVGKTYAMLEAGLRRQLDGQDVVVAWVDTNQQPATDALVSRMARLPVRPTDDIEQPYDMDVDAVLQRKPQLALVDDLAHRNAEGCRHAHRYQDVSELLQSGINVYSTINVQNLESLNDIVQQITGLVVEDTVPDSLLDEADELELVDLPAEELLQRLREGKSGEPGIASRRIGELAALRQMALRETAERVDGKMRGFMASQAIRGPWAATERVMVCLSAHPIGDRLVRSGRRLAEALFAEWFVVFVETPLHLQMLLDDRVRLQRSLRLAEKMGAQAITLTGESVVDALVEFAKQNNITRIIIGKPRRSRWLELFQGSRVDRLLERCGSTDVFVISDELPQKYKPVETGSRLRVPLVNYLYAVLLAGMVTAVALPLQQFFEPANLLILFLSGVVLAGAYLGRAPSVLTALASGASFAFLFDHQPYLLAPSDARHLVTLAGLLAAGLLTGTFTGWLRAQIRAARRREIQSAALNALSRDLTVAATLDDMLDAVLRHVSKTFHCQAAILLPEAGRVGVQKATPESRLAQDDLFAAQWAYANRQPAGAGTDTFREARACCLPLETRNNVVGVLAVVMDESGHAITANQRELLAGFDTMAALAIERAQLNEQAQQTAILQMTEKLQAALLNSISHDLRTPLSTVSGAISSLLEAEQNGDRLDSELRLDLLENADEEADRLNQLVGNLLDMTRLEAGAMRVRKRPSDVQDMIGSALVQASRRLHGRVVQTRIPPDLPDVAFDFVLMVQVLYNLLDNAAKYSQADTPIDVSAEIVEGELRICVADRGVGIPPDDLERIFDKFYRVQRPGGVTGTGLGLSICRGIVEVHGGRIWAQNRPEGGAEIVAAIPLNTPQMAE